jgi:3-dehydroquinate synthase class II
MTVGELKHVLAHHDDATVVVLARDCEGNGHSELGAGWAGRWDVANRQFYDERDDPNHDYDPKDTVDALVLSPKD